MKYKDDWEEASERWASLWNHSRTDRPVICVTAPNGNSADVPAPEDGSQKYMDADFTIRSGQARMETTWYGGESFPSAFLNAGWITTSYDAVPTFEMESIWFSPMEIDWDKPPEFDLDFGNEWFELYKGLHEKILDWTAELDVAMGGPCILPGHDLLSLLIDTQVFLMNLMDRPEWMKRTIEKVAANFLETREFFCELTRQKNMYWYGGGWTGFWGPEPYINMQSDVSCMLSPDMFEEFIMPELDMAGEIYGRMWYHLDGPDALKHLSRLLSLDYIKVIQWVPGEGAAPNGPEWMDVYRQIQDAGKIVDISMAPGNAEEVIKELDPSLLCIHTSCPTIQEGEDLLSSARVWV
jgi:hypothetical protein